MRLATIPLCAALALAAAPSPATAQQGLCLQLFIDDVAVGPCAPVPVDSTCVGSEIVVAGVPIGAYVCLPLPNTAR